MNYRNCETYLNEEVRRPIKHYLKGTDEKKAEKIMECVDYLCDKYREINAFGCYAEEVASSKMNIHDYMKYMHEKCEPVDYDHLESPFTDEELEGREWLLDNED